MVGEKTIVLFGAPWCASCKVQKAQLDQAGVDYRYVNIDDVEDDLKHFVDNIGVLRGIPVTATFFGTTVHNRVSGVMTVAEIKLL